jgi:hypothetical protein
MIEFLRPQQVNGSARDGKRRGLRPRGDIGLALERVESRLAMTGGFGDPLTPQVPTPPAPEPAAVMWTPSVTGGQTSGGLPSGPATPGEDLIHEIKMFKWGQGVSCVGAYPPVNLPPVRPHGLPGVIDQIDPRHTLPQDKLEDLVEQMQEAIDDTKVFIFWPGYCQRWVNEFESKLPPDVFVNPLVKEIKMMWEPSICIGGGHATYTIELTNETVITFDNGAVTGWDHYDIKPKSP